MKVVFSVLFRGEQFDYSFSIFSDEYSLETMPVIWSVDWGFSVPRCWTMSWMKTDRYIHWKTINKVTKEGREALLDKFGLKEWEDEFPNKRLIEMSPAQLAAERRKKERELNLPELEILSDTLDFVIGTGQIKHRAEDYS